MSQRFISEEMEDCLNAILEDLVQDEKLLPVAYQGKLYYPFTLLSDKGFQLDHKENGHIFVSFDDQEFPKIARMILLYAFDKSIAIDISKVEGQDIITWNDINDLRQYGFEGQYLKSSDKSNIQLYRVNLDSIEYQFLDCWNGLPDLDSTAYDQDATPRVEGDPFHRTKKMKQDEETLCTFILCPIGDLVFSNDSFDGEHPENAKIIQFHKRYDYKKIDMIIKSMQLDKELIQIFGLHHA